MERIDIPTNYQINLLTDPQDVVYDNIFPFLEYADLLRLRRVCKPLKDLSDEYISNNYKNLVRIINETNYPIGYFLQANIPSGSIHLQNSSPKFFGDPDIPEFLNLYGDKITHVHAHYFNNCGTLPELPFYNSLSNIQHLEVDCVDARKSQDADVGHPFPTNFKNLKTLKLNEIWISDPENLERKWDLINFCDKLDYLKFHPRFKNVAEDKTIDRNNSLDFLIKYIINRQRDNPDAPNLKFFDLQHHGDFSDYRKFAILVKLCYRYNIKLLNVPSSLVDRNSGIIRIYPRPFTNQLVSLRNVEGFMMQVELPQMESLIIESSKANFRYFWPENREEDEEDRANFFNDRYIIEHGDGGELLPHWRAARWPQLKSLDLTIDSAKVREIEGVTSKAVDAWKLFDFLFPVDRRMEVEVKVKELAIRFVGIGIQFPVPGVNIVTRACPFVTKLTLTNWAGGDDEEVSRFWVGMPLLEEVVLEKCKRLGDKAFIGRENMDDQIYWQLRELDDLRRRRNERRGNEIPAFLKLKNLKKLSLKNLELMPGITDQTFEKIFRHLKIKQFVMTSERPLNTITMAGITSLLTGNFNESVERFPFQGWSLMGVSDEALTQLKWSFRATYMR